jgi:hypothetical protein
MAFDDDVRALLAAYQRVRTGVADGGPIVSAGKARGWRPFVLYGLDDHVNRRAVLLRRRAHADTVTTGADHAATLGAVDHLVASLPPVPYRRLYAALVLLVSAASLGVIAILRSFEGTKALSRTLGAANDIVDTLSTRILTIDVGQIPDALKDLGSAGDARVLAFVAIIVLLSLYAILRPFTSTFRVRRELLCGEVAEREARVLGGRVPRELPFDLIVYALPMSLPLYVGLYMVGDGLVRGDAATSLVGLVLLTAPASARLAYLWRTWRRRTRVAPRVAATARFVAAAEQGSNPVRV